MYDLSSFAQYTLFCMSPSEPYVSHNNALWRWSCDCLDDNHTMAECQWLPLKAWNTIAYCLRSEWVHSTQPAITWTVTCCSIIHKKHDAASLWLVPYMCTWHSGEGQDRYGSWNVYTCVSLTEASVFQAYGKIPEPPIDQSAYSDLPAKYERIWQCDMNKREWHFVTNQQLARGHYNITGNVQSIQIHQSILSLVVQGHPILFVVKKTTTNQQQHSDIKQEGCGLIHSELFLFIWFYLSFI